MFKNCILKEVKPEVMTKISEKLFLYGCTSLEKLVLPDSITGIDALCLLENAAVSKT